jgi:hypothetical protein
MYLFACSPAAVPLLVPPTQEMWSGGHASLSRQRRTPRGWLRTVCFGGTPASRLAALISVGALPSSLTSHPTTSHILLLSPPFVPAPSTEPLCRSLGWRFVALCCKLHASQPHVCREARASLGTSSCRQPLTCATCQSPACCAALLGFGGLYITATQFRFFLSRLIWSPPTGCMCKTLLSTVGRPPPHLYRRRRLTWEQTAPSHPENTCPETSCCR